MPSFDINYPQNPWAAVTTKERPWYYPTLMREFGKKFVWNRFVGQEFNHNGPRAQELYIDTVMQPHANQDPIDPRSVWLETSMLDTFRRKITFQTWGGKMSFHKHDDLITFWERNRVAGLNAIIREAISTMMVDQMDKIARDTFMKMPFRMYGDGNGTFGGSSFATINQNDTVTPDLLQEIRLGLAERGVPGFQDDENGFQNAIFCITTPGVIHDLRTKLTATGNGNNFIDIARYAQPQRIFAGEVGSIYGIRFIQANSAILYNCGNIVTQKNITAPVSPGDGSPNPSTPVDGLEYVGQPGAVHYIQLNSVTDLSIGDVVSIHVDRTNAYGVTNGVDFTDGKLHVRRIVAIDATNNRISFDRPILESFATNLGGGVYGYVTKGRHIHTMTFISGPNPVVSSVAQPPTVYNPVDVGDRNAIKRVSYDFTMGWTPFEKNSAELVFLAGSNRVVGPRVI